MRNIAKAQYGMSRSLRRKYMNPMRCKSPNDPGCGARRAEKRAIRESKRADKQADKESRRQERQDKRTRGTQSIGDYPKIVKREYIMENESSGRPGKRRTMADDKIWKGENIGKGDWTKTGKKGVKVNKTKAAYGKLTKAKSGKKVSATTKKKK